MMQYIISLIFVFLIIILLGLSIYVGMALCAFFVYGKTISKMFKRDSINRIDLDIPKIIRINRKPTEQDYKFFNVDDIWIPTLNNERDPNEFYLFAPWSGWRKYNKTDEFIQIKRD